MKYPAMSVANIVIRYCIQNGYSLTNLKLQKLLYFIQGESYRNWKTNLIEEDFYAWRLGPVIPNVYFAYSSYAAFDLPLPKEQNNIDENSESLIRQTLEKYMRKSVWELVDITHQQDPWKYTYKAFGENSKISPGTMANYFIKKDKIA